MPKIIDADKLIRAISLLTALLSSTKDAKEYGEISESHVSELHANLTNIEKLGIDVTGFRIPDSEINAIITSLPSSSSRGGGTRHTYSDKKYVYKSIFLTKLNGILNYLNYILKEPQRSAGFKPKE